MFHREEGHQVFVRVVAPKASDLSKAVVAYWQASECSHSQPKEKEQATIMEASSKGRDLKITVPELEPLLQPVSVLMAVSLFL